MSRMVESRTLLFFTVKSDQWEIPELHFYGVDCGFATVDCLKGSISRLHAVQSGGAHPAHTVQCEATILFFAGENLLGSSRG
jgi:hypothetical protein